jgi:hypothetical protein
LFRADPATNDRARGGCKPAPSRVASSPEELTMGMLHRLALGSFAVCVALETLACGTGPEAPGPEGASASRAPAAGADADHTAAVAALQNQGRTLATLTPEPGRTVLFREIAPGAVVIEEHGQVGQAPIVDHAGKSLADVYRALTHGAEPPPEIARADEERRALTPADDTAGVPDALHASPPSREVSKKPVIHPLGGPDDTWFQDTFCDNVFESSCILATGAEAVTAWNTQGWSGNDSYTSNVIVYAYEESNVTAPSFFGIDMWNSSTGAWQTQYVGGITSANTWASAYWWMPTPHYFQGWISGGGPTGTVGVAILDFDPQLDTGGYPDDFTYGPSAYTGNLWFAGMQFQNDASVNVTVSYGSYSENMGNWPVTYGTPLLDYISDNAVGYFNTPGNNGVTMYCSMFSGGGSYTGTVTAVGQQTGQVATLPLGLVNCYPCNPGSAFCG